MRLFLISIFMLLGNFVIAQKLSSSEFNAAASEVNLGNIRFSQTVGQMFVPVISQKKGASFYNGFVLPSGAVAKSVKKNPESEIGVDIFPNPAVDYIYVNLRGKNIEDVFTIQFYNMMGQDISGEIDISNTEISYGERIAIDLRPILPGQYFIRLVPQKAGGAIATFKIIKN